MEIDDEIANPTDAWLYQKGPWDEDIPEPALYLVECEWGDVYVWADDAVDALDEAVDFFRVDGWDDTWSTRGIKRGSREWEGVFAESQAQAEEKHRRQLGPRV